MKQKISDMGQFHFLSGILLNLILIFSVEYFGEMKAYMKLSQAL